MTTSRTGGNALPPSRTSLRQSHRYDVPVIPRLSVRLGYFSSPGSLRTVLNLSSPPRYSIGVFSPSSPPTSWNAAITSPLIATVKLNALYGFLLGRSCMGNSSGIGGESGDLLDAEDNELRRPHDRHADLADQPPVLDVVGGHRRLIAPDVEG